jgi:hypothetical protein
MITIKRVNTLLKEGYVRYRQDPRHGTDRDAGAFCDAVRSVVVTGLVFEAAQIVLGAACERETELVERESELVERESAVEERATAVAERQTEREGGVSS